MAAWPALNITAVWRYAEVSCFSGVLDFLVYKYGLNCTCFNNCMSGLLTETMLEISAVPAVF